MAYAAIVIIIYKDEHWTKDNLLYIFLAYDFIYVKNIFIWKYFYFFFELQQTTSSSMLYFVRANLSLLRTLVMGYFLMPYAVFLRPTEKTKHRCVVCVTQELRKSYIMYKYEKANNCCTINIRI